MADLQITLGGEKIQEVLFGDRGMTVPMESVSNQALRSEMSTHLRAEPRERTAERRGYCNDSGQRELTTRARGRLQLEAPRDRDGTFSTRYVLYAALRTVYQRSGKALVLSLMQMVQNSTSSSPLDDVNEWGRVPPLEVYTDDTR